MTQSDSASEHHDKSPGDTTGAGAASSGKPRQLIRATRVRYGVLASLCAVAVIAYVQRNSIGVAETAISADLGLTKYQMGWVMSAFFWSYAVFQIPTALIGQVFGTRRALSVFVGLFSAVAGVFAIAMGMPLLLASRIGMGIGQAGSFPCAVQSISRWIPLAQRSISTGMLASCMSIGGAIGAAMTGALLPLLGWRVTFALFCLPGLIFAIWFSRWFRDRPEQHRSVNQSEFELIRASGDESSDNRHKPKDTVCHGARSAPLRMIYAWCAISALCGQQVCRAAGYMFFGSWFATYLRETRHVDDLEVGLLNSLPLLAVVAGAPTGGMVADWILKRTGSLRLSRQGVGTVAMLACCSMILVSYPITNPWLAVMTISIGSFFAAFGGPCAYTATIDMGGRFTPLVFGTMNMMGNFGAAIFPLVVPWLLGQGTTTGSGNWNLVLFTFAGLYFAAAIFWLLADARASVDFKN